jgi:hypothetical protein
MITNISKQTLGDWSNNSTMRLGGLFGIKWLKLSDLIFNKTNHLTNPWNEHAPDGPVKVCRDTQELPYEIGLKLCLLFDSEQNFPIPHVEKPKHLQNIDKFEDQILYKNNSQTISNELTNKINFYNNSNNNQMLERQESFISQNSINNQENLLK